MKFITDFKKLDVLAHQAVTSALSSYQYHLPIFIDATAGNGYDTCFLAQLAGTKGIVLAFDIQEQAITNTYQRLISLHLEKQVTLIKSGHERLYAETINFFQKNAYLVEFYHFNNQVDICSGVMFNLGFLPKSDKKIITQPTTTIMALNDALNVLAPGGIITIHCYTGHLGGIKESEAVLYWSEQLSLNKWDITIYKQTFKQKNNEQLVLIKRKQL